MEPLFSPDIHVLYEHSKIPLAIFYADGDRFHAYLVSEGFCRMHEATAEEMLDLLNRDEPFDNIVEKEEMQKAIYDFSRNETVYNVVFHEKIDRNGKIMTIHAIGEHEYTRDGRRYSIIRYDEISDTSRHFLFRDEEREIAERNRLYAEIDDAIARSYTSVVYVNTDDLTVEPVRLNRYGKPLEEVTKNDRSLRNVIDTYVKALVYCDDMQGVLRFGDYDYVIKALEENNPLYHTYRTVRDGRIVYYRLKIVPFDDGRKLIYGFEYFDDQMRERLARKTEYETQMTLLAGLSCEYDSVWLVDAGLHHAKFIRSNMDPGISEIMHAEKEGNYETLFGNYIEKYVVDEDRERLYSQINLSNLMRVTNEDEIYHINYYRINPENEKNHMQFCVAKVTDESGVVRFVMGFRNIDTITDNEGRGHTKNTGRYDPPKAADPQDSSYYMQEGHDRRRDWKKGPVS